MLLAAFLSFLLVYTTTAAPVAVSISSFEDFRRDGTSSARTAAVSSDTISNDLLRPAQFARVSYCSAASVTNWTCGGPCDSLGNNVQVLQAGGDDGEIPGYFVAHDSDTDTIVVAHQGTDPTNFLSILNDVEFALTDLNTTRFTSAADHGVQVHDGFQQTFERTADSILSAVQSALDNTGATNVLVTGHSLGAAVATLDTMLLRQVLPASTNVTATLFGLPRVGNDAFADFIDSIGGVTHVTNENDPVPNVPPRFLSFQHPAGEIHIKSAGDAGSAVNCPGQENDNCSDANNLLASSVQDHLGPYFNDISFGGAACPA